MPETLAIAQSLLTLRQVETRFQLSPNADPAFFAEAAAAQTAQITLSPEERQTLDRIRASYRYSSAEGDLTEATVNLLLVSPLLYLAGFCDPPFRLQAEASVEIVVDDRNERYTGRIDTLVICRELWVAIVESKRTRFAASTGIPQALAYACANSDRDRPLFALITNGDNFLFLKIQGNHYAISSDFSIYSQPENGLYGVLRLLKSIASQVEEIRA